MCLYVEFLEPNHIRMLKGWSITSYELSGRYAAALIARTTFNSFGLASALFGTGSRMMVSVFLGYAHFEIFLLNAHLDSSLLLVVFFIIIIMSHTRKHFASRSKWNQKKKSIPNKSACLNVFTAGFCRFHCDLFMFFSSLFSSLSLIWSATRPAAPARPQIFCQSQFEI